MTEAPQKSPLASPEPWDLVCDAYVAELWEMFSAFAQKALDLAALETHSEVRDVAAGPGPLALDAARRARRVVAVDFSAGMLEELTRRARAATLDNVETLQADGQALPLPDASFDAAFSMFGVIFFPDRARGFRELLRVLRPGGRAVVSSWRPFENVPELRLPFRVLVEKMPELPFGRTKAPLGEPEEIVAEMQQAGFTAIEVHPVSHVAVAPSPEAFWASMERSTVHFLLLKRRIGEERWKELSEAILARVVQELGPGEVHVEYKALLGTGLRP